MPVEKKQIIAIGGGGFDPRPGPTALEGYLLAQARRPRPAVAFVGTASGDANDYLVNFYATFTRYDCRPTHLTFFRRTPDLRRFLLEQDVLYVGGGNTKSLLGVWREWGLPALLREAWEAGVVLAGLSAGAICWFEQGLTDSFGDQLAMLPCLGFLPGSCSPHYDGEPERRPAYQALVAGGQALPGYAIDDFAALHFCAGEPPVAVASRPGAGTYRIEALDGAVRETPLPVRLLEAP